MAAAAPEEGFFPPKRAGVAGPGPFQAPIRLPGTQAAFEDPRIFRRTHPPGPPLTCHIFYCPEKAEAMPTGTPASPSSPSLALCPHRLLPCLLSPRGGPSPAKQAPPTQPWSIALSSCPELPPESIPPSIHSREKLNKNMRQHPFQGSQAPPGPGHEEPHSYCRRAPPLKGAILSRDYKQGKGLKQEGGECPLAQPPRARWLSRPVPAGSARPVPAGSARPVPSGSAAPCPLDQPPRALWLSRPVPAGSAAPCPLAQPAPCPLAQPPRARWISPPRALCFSCPVPAGSARPVPAGSARPVPAGSARPVPAGSAAPCPLDQPAPCPLDQPAPCPLFQPAPCPLAQPAPCPLAQPPRARWLSPPRARWLSPPRARWLSRPVPAGSACPVPAGSAAPCPLAQPPRARWLSRPVPQRSWNIPSPGLGNRPQMQRGRKVHLNDHPVDAGEEGKPRACRWQDPPCWPPGSGPPGPHRPALGLSPIRRPDIAAHLQPLPTLTPPSRSRPLPRRPAPSLVPAASPRPGEGRLRGAETAEAVPKLRAPGSSLTIRCSPGQSRPSLGSRTPRKRMPPPWQPCPPPRGIPEPERPAALEVRTRAGGNPGK
ncbi:uncharacterized protein LOC130453789 [Monodelphis domestica]|uniref:uncharacterized protein LOC130453789 n=1 Tax=Monodelphis domestica TaxID=13616 RepID=UPI0024E2692F|nr:uncharacterized protein LOC130453789 [Monodelphis domestica]